MQLTEITHGIYAIGGLKSGRAYLIEDKVGLTLEAEAGKFVDRRTALWLRPGIGLHGDDLPQVYNWNLQVGVRHTF